MPKSVRDVPPPLELLCLKALWTIRKATSRRSSEIVAETRPLAYTTIMTVLDRLTRKGKLARHKVGRAFVYSPQASRDAMRRVAIRDCWRVSSMDLRRNSSAFSKRATDNRPQPRQPPAPKKRRGSIQSFCSHDRPLQAHTFTPAALSGLP